MAAPSINAPEVTNAPARHVLAQHFVVSEAAIGPTMQRSFAALYERISAAGVIPAGPPFVIYNTMSAPWDMDVCAPIASPMSPSDTFTYFELPATRVVTFVHVGPYEELGRAYDEVENYVRHHDLSSNGAPREIYLSPPGTPPGETRTILEWPIE